MRCAVRNLVLAAMAGVLAAAPGARAADGHSLTVSATVVSNSNCRFSTAGSTLALSIDPASGAAATASGTLSIRCVGSAATANWSIAANSGLYGASPSALRMRHGTNPAEFLPYSLSFPASGSVPKNVWQDLTVTASVLPADFQNVSAGAYSDAVTLSLLP
jgi:spore coat protein U-like protein